MSEQDYAVRANGLTKVFSEGQVTYPVLRDLSISVRSGETVALRGRSGSGKSTLLNILGGIDVPDAGEVVVAGIDITALHETERTLFRREHIGFVYQAFNLVPTLSITDNICLVLELNGIDRVASRRRAEELLEAVGLGSRSDSFPDVLSGGEQQRVAIARALAHRPALILADEPTGNLDDATADTVLQLLSEMIEQVNGTMIVATHSIAVAKRCDRVLELHNGQLCS